jgi:hypothetical protein
VNFISHFLNYIFGSSNQNALETAEEADYIDHPQSPTRVPENLSSGDGDVSSSAIPEYNESKQDTALPSGGHQYSVVHTSPNYNFGFVPPVMGSQLAPVENSESQARDVSRLPSFIVSPQTSGLICYMFILNLHLNFGVVANFNFQ